MYGSLHGAQLLLLLRQELALRLLLTDLDLGVVVFFLQAEVLRLGLAAGLQADLRLGLAAGLRVAHFLAGMF